MGPSPELPPLLDAAGAAFIQRRTSISVAARDARNRPAVARAYGCRVSDDRRRITVFLCPLHAARVLECLAENGAIAMAVVRPSTHAALQIKGTVTAVAPLSGEDRAAMAAYRQSLVEEIVPLGYTAEFVRALVPGGEDCLAVSFAPAALFEQTPGPKAGTPLESRA